MGTAAEIERWLLGSVEHKADIACTHGWLCAMAMISPWRGVDGGAKEHRQHARLLGRDLKLNRLLLACQTHT